MRTFLAFLLALVFFFVFPLFVFSYSLNHILTPSYTKSTLAKSGVYQAIPNVLLSSIDQIKDKETGAPIEGQQELKYFVKNQITPVYVKDKVESSLDETFAYLDKKSNQPPGIVLTDLKPKIQQIFGSEPLPKEVDTFFSKPQTIPEKQAANLRSAFQFLQRAPVPIAFVGLALLFLILLLAKGLKSKLRWVSMTLFVPTICGLIGVALIIGLGQLTTSMVTNALSGSSMKQFADPVSNLLKPLVADLAGRMLLLYAIAFVVAAVLFAISFFVKSKVVPASTAPQKNTQQTPTQPVSNPQNAV